VEKYAQIFWALSCPYNIPPLYSLWNYRTPIQQISAIRLTDKISTKRNLYKIGFSTTTVEKRIQNAKKDPTYLMADVKTVAAYEVYNVNPHKLEQLIHTFFRNSCLDIDIYDDKGGVHRPKEWFIVPLIVIEEAIELIINGKILDYRYDQNTEIIIKR
jgi:hypothetical protein